MASGSRNIRRDGVPIHLAEFVRVCAGSARRQRRTATENPSAGVLSSADDWVAATVAIRPYDASVTDWAYNLLAIDSIDDTNVTVKVNVSTASATGGAKAKIALKVGKP